MVLIFTEGEGIESRLPFKRISTLLISYPQQFFGPSYGPVNVHNHVVSLVLPEIETGVTSLEIRTHLDIESFVLSGEHDST